MLQCTIFLNLHSLSFLPHRSLYIICICWPTVSETRHHWFKRRRGGRKRQSGKSFKAFDGSSLIDAGTSRGQRGQRWRGRDFGEVHRPLCKHTLRFLRCALLLPRNKLPFPWSQLWAVHHHPHARYPLAVPPRSIQIILETLYSASGLGYINSNPHYAALMLVMSRGNASAKQQPHKSLHGCSVSLMSCGFQIVSFDSLHVSSQRGAG